MICEKCGAELWIGAFPFCPHGEAVPGKLADVTWAGGRTFENLAHQPQTFYSQAEYRRFLKTTGQREFVRWAGEHDKHVPRWVTMDPYTLEQARLLLERVGNQSAASSAEPYNAAWESFTVTDLLTALGHKPI